MYLCVVTFSLRCSIKNRKIIVLISKMLIHFFGGKCPRQHPLWCLRLLCVRFGKPIWETSCMGCVCAWLSQLSKALACYIECLCIYVCVPVCVHALLHVLVHVQSVHPWIYCISATLSKPEIQESFIILVLFFNYYYYWKFCSWVLLFIGF